MERERPLLLLFADGEARLMAEGARLLEGGLREEEEEEEEEEELFMALLVRLEEEEEPLRRGWLYDGWREWNVF